MARNFFFGEMVLRKTIFVVLTGSVFRLLSSHSGFAQNASLVVIFAKLSCELIWIVTCLNPLAK